MKDLQLNLPAVMKRGVVTFLVDRALQVCSTLFLDSELDLLRDVLFGNGYLIRLINSVIETRTKKLSNSVMEIQIKRK